MLAILSTFLLLAAAGGSADLVELKNGQRIEGRVVFQDEATVVLRVGSRDREFETKDIAKLDSRLAAHRLFLARWIAHTSTDLPPLYDMLAMAKDAGNEGDHQLLAGWILSRLPGSEEANEALGHVKKGETWFVRDGSRRLSWEELVERRAEWSEAWELRTQHYHVRSNLGLAQTTDLAFGLECTHAAFDELFGAPLRLLDTTEPLVVHVHADKRSFPEFKGIASSYFEPTSRVLHVDASTAFDTTLVVHGACRQLIDAHSRSTRGSRGSIPGWLDEGLSEYVRSGCVGEFARWTHDATGEMRHHFETHARAEAPFALSRVLSFELGDFHGTSQRSLKYAQAYTLVTWAMRAREGKYRPAFFEFLRSAFDGRGSPTDFKSAFGMEEAAIEKDWLDYVQRAILKR